jgi:hypothetical protein
MKTLLAPLTLLAGAVAMALTTAACTTESFCLADCDPNAAKGTGGSGPYEGGQGAVFNIGGTGGGQFFQTGGVPVGGCGAAEIPCNNFDDNCNGSTDEGTDFTELTQCGDCASNCFVNAPPNMNAVGCTPPAADQLGKAPGECKYECAADWYDTDPTKPGCEKQCQKTNDVDIAYDNVCGVDDDCDGEADEDIDYCNDAANCGACGSLGVPCVLANATGKCQQIAGATTCRNTKDATFTECVIGSCATGWHDADGRASTGCEYQCTPSNGGVEICDGLDNDCDNLFDNEDDGLTGVGADCFGGTVGECAAASHKGKNKCIAGVVTCCDVSSDSVTSQSTNPKQPLTGAQNGICKGTQAPFVLHPTENEELCNGLDDNCDGQTDESPSDVGQACGTSVGKCALGVMQCDITTHKPVCVGATDPDVDPTTKERIDVCDGVDDDCDGVTDGTVVDTATGTPAACTRNQDCPTGASCLMGPNGLACVLPKVCATTADCPANTQCMQSVNNKVCAKPADTVGAICDKPAVVPACVNASGNGVPCTDPGAIPVTQPCKEGKIICVGKPLCGGSTVANPTAKDTCGKDMNCDGRLDNQPNLLTDERNCGACGNDCNALGAHVNWVCNNGTCAKGTPACVAGYINCDSNANDCERQCTPSGAEVCNGIDDNCNCQVDDGNIPKPTSVQVCGVQSGSTDPNCTTNVTIACTAGAWKCTFPAGVCTSGTCSTSPDPCDGIDNNCNSVADESFKTPFKATKYLTQPCASDDGLPAPGHGACRGTGTYVCNPAGTDTQCSAVKDNSNAGTEVCDGIDNDCDAVVDEAYNNATGAANGNYVKPEVVNIGASRWIFKYEASRPNAGTANPGSGNGYFTSAPAGTTLDRTVACSVQGKIPWSNLTPQEAAQTCTNRGGQLCTNADWKTACKTSAGTPCTWGYSTACTTAANYAAVNGPFCNLGAFDFDATTTPMPNDDGLLVTGSTRLKQCSATWGTNGVFDITGNLREITVDGSAYTLMGGSYVSSADSGATCDFDFYSVDQNFKFPDTGFRCCFTTNPSP